ncbi:MAG: helix-turn-helix transcriptional regulator [Candidatus Omnitrophota bacterium]|jgi:DNA-binding XRE family transcriptional regulator
MGVDKSWLWNVKTTDAEARKILADPEHPAFQVYAARRLATANLPREVFRDYLKKEDFLKSWPVIKRQMRTDSRNRDRIIFWQGVYEYLIKDLKAKGTPFVRPKALARIDPGRQKTGQGIRDQRRLRKMTQAELAQKTGLTQQHIAKIEKGVTCPRPQTMEKIEKALGVSSHEYKTGEAPFRVDRVTETVTTWLSPETERRTESK